MKKALVVFILLSASLFAAEEPAFTASTEVQFAYREAERDMAEYFGIGRGFRTCLFAGVTLPMVKSVNAA